MKKLLSISLAFSLFLAISSTALAAPSAYWTQNYRQNFAYSYNYSYLYGTTQKPGQNNTQGSRPDNQAFWQQLMDKLEGGQNQNGGTDATTRPEENNSAGNTSKPGTTISPDTESNSSYQQQVVALVNQERAKQGLSPVTADSRISAAAQVRAQEAAQSFSHTRPNGTSCFTALKEAGISYRGAGENIAYGQKTPQSVMEDWMNSSGHRANILNAKYTKIGVGYTVINGTPYWSQFFTY